VDNFVDITQLERPSQAEMARSQVCLEIQHFKNILKNQQLKKHHGTFGRNPRAFCHAISRFYFLCITGLTALKKCACSDGPGDEVHRPIGSPPAKKSTNASTLMIQHADIS
jgi:hypothetical protein